MFQKTVKKFKNMTKNDILWSFFILFVFIILIGVIINNNFLQFAYNGFNKLSKSDLKVYYLDVGQASANVIIFPNKTSMIIDTGSQDSEDEFLDAVDLIFQSNKIKEIDFLVLTHSDEDHIGGTAKLLQKYQVNTIYRPKLLSNSVLDENLELPYLLIDTYIYAKVINSVYQEPNCEVRFLEDQTMKIGDSMLKFYTAQYTDYIDSNYYCPFITIDFADKNFMFTGDATRAREYELLAEFEENDLNIQVDFLNVAHHGSKYSSCQDFLSAINPTYAIISAGDKNHPHEDVLKRLKEIDANVYCTKNHGMIAIGLNADESFSLLWQSDFLDLPFLVVVIACGTFILLKMYYLSKKNQKKFKKTIKFEVKTLQK